MHKNSRQNESNEFDVERDTGKRPSIWDIPAAYRDCVRAEAEL